MSAASLLISLFHATLYSQNSVHDPDTLHAMVEGNVPRDRIGWSRSKQPRVPAGKLVFLEWITERGTWYQSVLDVAGEA